MSQQMRRYTFRLYPTAAQDAALWEQSRMMAQLWNALLQRREDIYRRERRTPSSYEQKREITELRAACPEWRAISVAAARGVADRLDLAFKAFFRRTEQGQGAASGYPRYRRTKDGTSISFSEKMGSGWSLKRIKSDGKSGGWRFYVKGVAGLIKARGCFPLTPEEYRTAEVIRRDEAWWLSIVVKLPVRRSPGQERIRITFDLIDEFARVERAEGRSPACSQEQITGLSQHVEAERGLDAPRLASDEKSKHHDGERVTGLDAPRLASDEKSWLSRSAMPFGLDAPRLASDEKNLARLSAAGLGLDAPRLASDEKGTMPSVIDHLKSERDRRFRKFSWRWRRETRRIARRQTRLARRRRYDLHVWTTSIVRSAADITLVTPPVNAMTQSPRGDERNWGACVATVSMLNRAILIQAPTLATQMLCYKATEAGIRFDLAVDENSKIVIGRDLVAAGRAIRAVRRKTKEG